MRILNNAVMCGALPISNTRGQAMALFRTTIAPELKRRNLPLCHGTVRDWFVTNCNADQGLAEILTDALQHAQETAP